MTFVPHVDTSWYVEAMEPRWSEKYSICCIPIEFTKNLPITKTNLGKQNEEFQISVVRIWWLFVSLDLNIQVGNSIYLFRLSEREVSDVNTLCYNQYHAKSSSRLYKCTAIADNKLFPLALRSREYSTCFVTSAVRRGTSCLFRQCCSV